MKHIGLVVFPGFQILDTAAAAVFEMANLTARMSAYDIALVSESGGAVKSSVGAVVQTIALDPTRYDTLHVTGANDVTPSTPKLLRQLARAAQYARRTASICTGAFILAEAGLGRNLLGKRSRLGDRNSDRSLKQDAAFRNGARR